MALFFYKQKQTRAQRRKAAETTQRLSLRTFAALRLCVRIVALVLCTENNHHAAIAIGGLSTKVIGTVSESEGV